MLVRDTNDEKKIIDVYVAELCAANPRCGC